MPLTPQITLTANLLDYSGNQIGSIGSPAYLRIALCGFGAVPPSVAATGMLGKIASWPQDLPYTGSLLTVKLFGNDVITPGNTFYSISILDAGRNVIQSAAYQFSGTGTFDLSSLTPMTFPGQTLPVIGALFSTAPTLQKAAGTVDGVNQNFTFSAGSAAPLIALFAGGIYQSALVGIGDYSLTWLGSNTWQITFATAPTSGPIIVMLFQQTGSGSRTITVPTVIFTNGLNPDNTIFCNFFNPGTITLPSAATAGAGYELTFIDVSYNAVANTITLSGGVNNGSSYAISTNGGAVTLRSDGTTWRIKSKF